MVVCCVAATSSDRSGISASPTGFRDKASVMCSCIQHFYSRSLRTSPV